MEHARTGLILSPNDQDIHQFYDFAGIACLVDGQYREALSFAEMSNAEQPDYLSNLKQLVVLHVELDNMVEARRRARHLLEIDPHFSLSSYRLLCPLAQKERVEWFLDRMSAAGVPD